MASFLLLYSYSIMGNYPLTNGPLGIYVAGGSEAQTKRTLAYKQGTLLRLRACISFGMPWKVPRGLDVERFLRAADASFPYCTTALQLGDFFSFLFLGEVVPLALARKR